MGKADPNIQKPENLYQGTAFHIIFKNEVLNLEGFWLRVAVSSLSLCCWVSSLYVFSPGYPPQHYLCCALQSSTNPRTAVAQILTASLTLAVCFLGELSTCVCSGFVFRGGLQTCTLCSLALSHSGGGQDDILVLLGTVRFLEDRSFQYTVEEVFTFCINLEILETLMPHHNQILS